VGPAAHGAALRTARGQKGDTGASEVPEPLGWRGGGTDVTRHHCRVTAVGHGGAVARPSPTTSCLRRVLHVDGGDRAGPVYVHAPWMSVRCGGRGAQGARRPPTRGQRPPRAAPRGGYGAVEKGTDAAPRRRPTVACTPRRQGGAGAARGARAGECRWRRRRRRGCRPSLRPRGRGANRGARGGAGHRARPATARRATLQGGGRGDRRSLEAETADADRNPPRLPPVRGSVNGNCCHHSGRRRVAPTADVADAPVWGRSRLRALGHRGP